MVDAVAQGDASHSEDKPQSISPECYDEASATSDYGERAEKGPTESFELIGVEPFLEAHHEEDHSPCEEDEADQVMVLE